VQASRTFTDVSIPYSIDTPVAGANLMLNGTLQASGTATATLNLALSFNQSLMDTDRISVLYSTSQLGLSFDALTALPIAATAALGLNHVQVNGGSVAVGAQGSNGADTTTPATVKIGFAYGSGGRQTLTQINANPTAALTAPVYTGEASANLPLVSQDGTTSATVGLSWYLGYPPSSNNPNVSGATQAANLNVTPSSLLTDTTLGATAATGLQQLPQWSTAVATAAGLTPAFSTDLPLLGADLSNLSQLPTILSALTSAISSYATAAADTADFAASIAAAVSVPGTRPANICDAVNV
jgi:hypothetical protein